MGGHRIDFDNGVLAKDFKRRIPFSDHPVNKFGLVETAIPFREVPDARLLDISCCAGYNSIHAAMNYGACCTGIDAVPPQIEISHPTGNLRQLATRRLLCLGSLGEAQPVPETLAQHTFGSPENHVRSIR
jgi:2-polyprenyl-3-methyl-5-hydroxy-6-metoxy-1,4-benzoquinol methylase